MGIQITRDALVSVTAAKLLKVKEPGLHILDKLLPATVPGRVLVA